MTVLPSEKCTNEECQALVTDGKGKCVSCRRSKIPIVLPRNKSSSVGDTERDGQLNND